MRARRLLPSVLLVLLLAPGLGAEKSAAPSLAAGVPSPSFRPAKAPASGGGINSIEPAELKEWLSYIASDELQGRQIYTEGLGLAAAYVARTYDPATAP